MTFKGFIYEQCRLHIDLLFFWFLLPSILVDARLQTEIHPM